MKEIGSEEIGSEMTFGKTPGVYELPGVSREGSKVPRHEMDVRARGEGCMPSARQMQDCTSVQGQEYRILTTDTRKCSVH